MSASSAALRSVDAPPPFVDAADHLLAELARLDLALRVHIHLLAEPRGDDERARRDLALDALGAPAQPDATDALLHLLADRRRIDEQRAQAACERGVRLPLLDLARRLGLDRVALGALLLALAPHVDRRYEAVFAYLQGDPRLVQPCVDLFLALFARDARERLDLRAHLADDAPLIAAGLLRLVPEDSGAPLLRHALAVPERLVEHLLGRAAPDRLVAAMQLHRPFPPVTQSLVEALGPLAQQLLRPWPRRPVALVRTEDPAAALSVFAALADAERRPFLVVDLSHPAVAGAPADERVRLALQEATWTGAWLAVLGADGLDPLDARRLVARLEGHRETVLLADLLLDLDLRPIVDRPLLRVELPPPGSSERAELWRCFLTGGDDERAALAERLALRHRLGASQIRGAAASAAFLAAARLDPRDSLPDLLDQAARAHARGHLPPQVQRVEPFGAWDDLVLPPESLQQCRELIRTVRHRETVLGAWGMQRKTASGASLAALFVGPPGTGKTMTASLIARQLGLDLLRVDLSGVVSKYIGETEKNIERILRASRTSNAVLFFDEADALFGKRTDVHDAHDRYANIETSYLLQRLEHHEGIVLLATNLKRNLDDAFLRRMAVVVEFPAPDRAHRRRLWDALLPPEMPRADDLDLDFLAERFELTGGHIRNIVMTAATLAAAAGGPLTFGQLLLGVRRELQKLGRLAGPHEFGRYQPLFERAVADEHALPL